MASVWIALAFFICFIFIVLFIPLSSAYMPLSLPHNMEPSYSYHNHTGFQSGISLCCSGTKPDAYGFRWRFYEGPPIDCENDDLYTCLSVLSITQLAFHLQCLLLPSIRYDLRHDTVYVSCIQYHPLLILNNIAVFL